MYEDLRYQYTAIGGQFTTFKGQVEGLLQSFITSQNAFRGQLENFSKGIALPSGLVQRDFTKVELDERIAKIMAELSQVNIIQGSLQHGVQDAVRRVYTHAQAKNIMVMNLQSHCHLTHEKSVEIGENWFKQLIQEDADAIHKEITEEILKDMIQQ